MRRVFISILLLAGMTFSAATQENSMWIGGTLSLTGEDNGQTRSTTTIMPELGYNINQAWAIGGRVGFTTDRTVQQGNTRRENTTSIIPFARYTFGDVAGFQVFGQGEMPLHFFGGNHYDGTSMDGSNSIGLAVRPGVSYSFTERWGFNMLMPSVLSIVSTGDGNSSYALGINDGYTIQRYLLSTSIGFIYMF